MTRTTVIALVVLLVSWPSPGVALSDYADEPIDSPLWWTLSDDVSPEDLYRRHNADPAEYRQRLLASGSTLSEEGLEKLTYFFQPKSEPELTPLWFTVMMLSARLESPRGLQATVDELTRRGLSKKSFNTIHGALRIYVDERAAEVERNRDDVHAFVRLMQQANDLLPADAAKAEFHQDMRAGRLAKLRDSSVVGLANSQRSIQELERLHAAWRSDPVAEPMRVLLPYLKTELGPEDWEIVCGFLLQEIAPTIGGMINFQPY